jgi:dipeptidyl aminopeptidase/acylaminoacyl peptidase
LTIDAALPGHVNLFEIGGDSGRILVSSYSDREPVRWYLLDEKSKTLEDLLESRPWLTPDKLVEMRPVSYPTRDGKHFMGYLLMPRGTKAGARLPAIVHIHGGPHARPDTWGFGSFGSREGQLFAAQGYAVLIPTFRMTPGFGSTAYYSGFGQMGRAMQDDIEDATQWLIDQGIADPKRICLSGASYGGYAALMGVVKTPDLYRCTVAGAAVTDLPLQLTSPQGDTVRSPAGLAFWHVLAGNPATDRAQMESVSPAYQAARIKARVFIWSGIDDIRVPFEQATRMRSALVAAGNPPQWMAKEKEGHGFGKVANNVELYEAILDFLAKSLALEPK